MLPFSSHLPGKSPHASLPGLFIGRHTWKYVIITVAATCTERKSQALTKHMRMWQWHREVFAEAFRPIGSSECLSCEFNSLALHSNLTSCSHGSTSQMGKQRYLMPTDGRAGVWTQGDGSRQCFHFPTLTLALCSGAILIIIPQGRKPHSTFYPNRTIRTSAIF